MYSVSIRKLLLIIHIVIVTCSTRVATADTPLTDAVGNSADEHGNIVWSQLPSATPSTLEGSKKLSGSLTTFYDMIHGFVDAVFIKGIPEDVFQHAANGELEKIYSNYTQYLTYIIGYGICVVLGLLFVIIFPVITCCFCCCRCCCNKDKGQTVEEAQNTCKKVTLTLVLLGTIAFTVAGLACMKINNDKVSSAIDAVPSVTRKSYDELRNFVNDTVMQARHVTGPNFDFLQATIFRDLDNVGNLVGLPLRQTIETQTDIRGTLLGARDLFKELNDASTALDDVNTKMTSLETSITDLTTKMSTVQSNVATIFTACGLVCPTAARPDLTALGSSVNVNLPDLTTQTSSMNMANNTDMESKLTQVEKELDNIPNKVDTESAAVRQDIKTSISDIRTDIDPMTDYLDDADDWISGDKAASMVDPVFDTIDTYTELAGKYDKYRWYGGLGITASLLFITLLATVGLMLGLLGSNSTTHPADRGCASNCGGVCLMVFVWLGMLQLTPFMLLTTLPFMAGSPIQAFMCKPISDIAMIDDIVNTFLGSDDGSYIISKMIFNDGSIPLTLSSILSDCQNDRSAYQTFKLDARFNISDMLDYSKHFDMEAEVNKVNIDLSSVEVYPPDLVAQLDDIKKAINIDFASIYTELNNPPVSQQTQLGDLANDLDIYADQLVSSIPGATAPPETGQLKVEATQIRNISNNELQRVIDQMNALNASVNNLDGHVTKINTLMTSLDVGLKRADAYITTNTSADISSILKDYANRMKRIVDSYIQNTLDEVTDKMGRCKPVWNVYDTLLIHTLCHVVDTFNGMWFALGWSIFFMLPGIICSVKLVRFYKSAGGNKVRPSGPLSGPGTKRNTWERMQDRNKVYPAGPEHRVDENLWRNRMNKIDEF